MTCRPLISSLAAVALSCFGASAATAQEPHLLEPLVASGELPPLAERLPSKPRQDLPQRVTWQNGAYGGTLRMLDRGGRDARAFVVFGYARLMTWNEDLVLVPDILLRVDVEEGKRFTLHLRPGHRWSDGARFTSEDFRFWWEDIANNSELSPRGLPRSLLVEGEAPAVSFPAADQVRFVWTKPNREFLPALAATSPAWIYRPAHYLKRYHPRYHPIEELEQEAQAAGLPSWAARFERLDRPYGLNNPERPTLQPWRLESGGGASGRWHGVRNPYFHRIDSQGRQLPYIDRLLLTKATPQLIAARTAAGESDLQAHGLTFKHLPVLRGQEQKAGYETNLWPIGRGAQMALYPNLTTKDEAWRALLRERDARRALSLAVDRDEINQVVYAGQAMGGNNGLLPESPLYREDERYAWAAHDPAEANRLLDGLGLSQRDARGYRLWPNGQRMVLIIEFGDVDPAESDVLQIIQRNFGDIGIEALITGRGRSVFRQRVRAGETVMSLFYGLANGVASRNVSPAELAPTSTRQNNWPAWGRYAESGGRSGEAPDLPAAESLLEHYRAWRTAGTSQQQSEAWDAMLAIHAEEVFSIGLVAGVLQPVAVRENLRNVPKEGAYLFEPGSYFGRYRPDTFWFEQ